MSDLQRGGTDGSGFSDTLVVSVNGIEEHRRANGVKGPDPAVWGDEQAAIPATIYSRPLGALTPGVKGPDPEQWAPDVVAGRLSDECAEIVDGGVEGEPSQPTWQEYVETLEQ